MKKKPEAKKVDVSDTIFQIWRLVRRHRSLNRAVRTMKKYDEMYGATQKGRAIHAQKDNLCKEIIDHLHSMCIIAPKVWKLDKLLGDHRRKTVPADVLTLLTGERW